MVGLVIVSHSYKIAEGIKDLTDQIAAAHKGIICAGGMEDKSILQPVHPALLALGPSGLRLIII